jgi:hypothetical protein
LQWSPLGVSVKGTSYNIVRLHFTERRHAGAALPAAAPAVSAAADTLQSALPMET